MEQATEIHLPKKARSRHSHPPPLPPQQYGLISSSVPTTTRGPNPFIFKERARAPSILDWRRGGVQNPVRTCAPRAPHYGRPPCGAVPQWLCLGALCVRACVRACVCVRARVFPQKSQTTGLRPDPPSDPPRTEKCRCTAKRAGALGTLTGGSWHSIPIARAPLQQRDGVR